MSASRPMIKRGLLHGKGPGWRRTRARSAHGTTVPNCAGRRRPVGRRQHTPHVAHVSAMATRDHTRPRHCHDRPSNSTWQHVHHRGHPRAHPNPNTDPNARPTHVPVPAARGPKRTGRRRGSPLAGRSRRSSTPAGFGEGSHARVRAMRLKPYSFAQCRHKHDPPAKARHCNEISQAGCCEQRRDADDDKCMRRFGRPTSKAVEVERRGASSGRSHATVCTSFRRTMAPKRCATAGCTNGQLIHSRELLRCAGTPYQDHDDAMRERRNSL